jgi:phytoene dehydrogenase-like protein
MEGGNMAEKSLLIVGGGMAGLAAGCYAQTNGYRSEILEAGRVAGGLCSAWTRKGYTFDTSIHFLSGWKTGALRAVWEELGAVQGREFIVHEEARTDRGPREDPRRPSRPRPVRGASPLLLFR